jgi:ABC-type antimicrobial peptide transport system ATPase subunit
MLDVKDAAVTEPVTPGTLLPGAQTLACIGDRVVGTQTLVENIAQINAPGIGVAMFDCCSR